MPADGDHDPEGRLLGPGHQLREGSEAGFHLRHHVAEAADLVADHQVDGPDESAVRPAAFDQRGYRAAQFAGRRVPVPLGRVLSAADSHRVHDTLAAFAEPVTDLYSGTRPHHPQGLALQRNLAAHLNSDPSWPEAGRVAGAAAGNGPGSSAGSVAGAAAGGAGVTGTVAGAGAGPEPGAVGGGVTGTGAVGGWLGAVGGGV